MKVKALVRVLPLVLVGILVALASSAKGGGKTPITWGAGDIKWTESPKVKGAWIAPLWGDPNKGAYGALKKVSAGMDLGWHSHSFDQKVVAVSGTFDFQLEGGQVKELAPGSYVLTPAHVKHSSKCREGSECIYFEEQPGKADFIPAK